MIQKQLVDKLALKMLEGEFGEGDTVRVDAADGELVFEQAAQSLDSGDFDPGSIGFGLSCRHRI